MKYQGSKNRFKKELIPIIQSCINDNTTAYIEPFVGGANVIDKIAHPNRRGYDAHPYLIALLKALEAGWLPPENVDAVMYADIKAHPEKYPDELVGFAGFQLTFGSMWMGSYRRDNEGRRNYAREAYNNVKKQAPLLKGISFECKSFENISGCNNCVIYCDPPYKNTAGYSTGAFDYDTFYNWVRDMSKNNIVLVSEYTMPDDFECIWEHNTTCQIGTTRGKRIEKLWRLK